VSTYTVAGGGLTATIDPVRGGRILSLRGPDGREWLSQPADRSRRPERGDAVFTASDPAGWDECAPSIDACEVGGSRIPDHGDLWTAEWTIVLAAPDSLELSVIGRSLGYRLVRRITATERGLRLDYVASAISTATPFLWAAHPQFVSPPGSVLELPASVSEVVDVLDPDQPVLSWSAGLATVDSLPDGGCRKLYVAPDSRAGSATLRHPDGADLTMSWQNCAYLGLWFDNRAYSREPVVAIEPSLGFRDSLSWAVEHGDAPVLAPGHDLRWSLEVGITPAT
jgi:hypothetical protein